MIKYDVEKFDRERQIDVFNVTVGTWLEALDSVVTPAMQTGNTMSDHEVKMAIYHLEGIVTEQQDMIRYLLARDNKSRRRWWQRGRTK